MADTAAHLVDHVLPEEPYRQWVLSVPWEVRFDFARNARLLSEAVKAFIKEVFRSYGRRGGLKKFDPTACGAVSAVQRFGSSLNCHVHIQAIVLDGIYGPAADGVKRAFRPLPPPDPEDLEEVLTRVRRKIAKLLVKHGCL